MLKQLKQNLLYSIIIVMSFVTILIISQLHWAYNHNYNDIVLRIVLAISLGTVIGGLYLFIVRFLSKKMNIDSDKSLKKLSIVHLPLYLLWIYELRITIGKMPFNRVLFFIVVILFIGLFILLLGKEFYEFLKKYISKYLANIFPPILLLFICSSISYYLLPKGINVVFVSYLSVILLFLVIFLFIYSMFFYKINKIDYIKKIEKLHITDFIFALIPVTPIVLYIFSNQDSLLISDFFIVFGFFAILSLLICVILPMVLSFFASKKVLMSVSTGFLYTIFNMASLSSSNNWRGEGSLLIQLIVLIVAIAILMLHKLISQKIFNTAIILFFVVNTVTGFISIDMIFSKDLPSVKELEDRKMIRNNDVFLIVYESYSNYETMLYYGFDNIEQLNFLEKNGFHIHHSTYSIGADSIHSMSRVFSLNREMEHKIYIAGRGIVYKLFSQQGYTNHSVFQSDYFFRGLTVKQINLDYPFPFKRPDSYELLINVILGGEFSDELSLEGVGFDAYLERKYQILRGEFISPILMYSHSPYPGHSPNTGKCRPNETELHINGIKRANNEMKKDIELILKHNPNAIVIIAGDHGPYLTKNCRGLPDDDYTIENIDRYDIQDRYGAFLAIRWGKDKEYATKHDIRILQDIFPAVFSYLYDDDSIFEDTKMHRITRGFATVGVTVEDDIIVGGKNDGEPLFIMDFDN